jgi:hypothetical protein
MEEKANFPKFNLVHLLNEKRSNINLVERI